MRKSCLSLLRGFKMNVITLRFAVLVGALLLGVMCDSAMADPSQLGACRYLGFDGEHCVLETNGRCASEYGRSPLQFLGWSRGVYCSGGQMSPLASPCINGCIRTLRACPHPRFPQHNTCLLVYNQCEQACMRDYPAPTPTPRFYQPPTPTPRWDTHEHL